MVHRATEQIEHDVVAGHRVQHRELLRRDVGLNPHRIDREPPLDTRVRVRVELAEPFLEQDRWRLPVVRAQELRLAGGTHLDVGIPDVDRQVGHEPLREFGRRDVRVRLDVEQHVSLVRHTDPLSGRAADEQLVPTHQDIWQRADDRDAHPRRERQGAPDPQVPELRLGLRKDPLSRGEVRDQASFRRFQERREPRLDPGRVDRDHERVDRPIDEVPAGVGRARQPRDVGGGGGRVVDRRVAGDDRGEPLRKAARHPREPRRRRAGPGQRGRRGGRRRGRRSSAALAVCAEASGCVDRRPSDEQHDGERG